MRWTCTAAVATIALAIAAAAEQDDAAALARGAALWASGECASCHEGGEARPLEGLSRRYDVARLTELLKSPPPGMERFDFDDAERADLAAYLLAAFP
jgi:mono/diheme cytochrome c family protein